MLKSVPNKTPVFFRLLFPIFIAIFSTSGYSLSINGIAGLNQLGVDVYYAALLVENPSTEASALLAMNQPMVMEIRVLSPISKRRWASFWTQGVAINATSAEFVAEAEEFSRFLGFFAGPLESGDIVRISYAPGNGATVSVNNINLGNNLSPGVFALCLKSWIGPVPFSTAFKDALLGKISSSDLAVKYNSVQPIESRQTIISGWATALTATDELAVDENAPDAELEAETGIADVSGDQGEAMAVEAEAPQESLSIAEPAADASTNGTEATENKAQSADSIASATADISGENGVQGIVLEEPLAEATDAEPAPSTATQTAAPQAAQATAIAADSSETGQEEELEDFSAESLIAQQRYINTVRQEISKVTVYPISALRRKMEGALRVTLVINASGDLVEVRLVEKAEFDAFNKALLSAVQSASPFPAFPAEMKTRQFTIELPFAFRLPQP